MELITAVIEITKQIVIEVSGHLKQEKENNWHAKENELKRIHDEKMVQEKTK